MPESRRSFLREMLYDALNETRLTLVHTLTMSQLPEGAVGYAISRTTRPEELDQGGSVTERRLFFGIIGKVGSGISTTDDDATDDDMNRMIETIETALMTFDCDGYKLRTDDYLLKVDSIEMDVDVAATLADGKGEIALRGWINYTQDWY